MIKIAYRISSLQAPNHLCPLFSAYIHNMGFRLHKKNFALAFTFSESLVVLHDNNFLCEKWDSLERGFFWWLVVTNSSDDSCIEYNDVDDDMSETNKGKGYLLNS